MKFSFVLIFAHFTLELDAEFWEDGWVQFETQMVTLPSGQVGRLSDFTVSAELIGEPIAAPEASENPLKELTKKVLRNKWHDFILVAQNGAEFPCDKNFLAGKLQ